VIGDVAAARRLEETDALRAEDVVAGEEMIELSATAESDDGRVFEEEKLIGKLLGLAQLDELLLEP
jgi:hypothetical protein